MQNFYSGGINCPICSDIQNPKGQGNFTMVKVEDYKIKCDIY